MFLGIDPGNSRVRLLSDDLAIVARTGGRLSGFRAGRGQSDEKGRATLPDSNEGAFGAADLCAILNANAKNTEPTTHFPDNIRLVLRNVPQSGAGPCTLSIARNGFSGRAGINWTESGALFAGCGA